MERLAHFVRSPEAGLWGKGTRASEHRDRTKFVPAQLVSGQASLLLRRGPSSDTSTSRQGISSEQSGLCRAKVTMPSTVNGPLVGTACLETETLPLHQQIIDFSRRARAAGVQQVRLVPLFLLAGVHVMEDIPAEVEQARRALPNLTLEVCPHLGSHPGMLELLRHKLRATSVETPVVLAHGSRRAGGNDSICALAQSLGGTAAFWAVAPKLESQIIHHMQSGVQRVAILPYFLFAGTTTDAITHLTEELAERFPKMGFHLLPPLGPSPELARLVIDLALDQVPTKAQQPPRPMQRVAFRHAVHPSSVVS